MARKSKEQPIVIGFFGTGEVDSKEVDALLEDYLSDKGDDVTFVVPVTKVHFTDTLQAVVDFANEVDPPIPYEVVTDEASASARNLKKVLNGAAKSHSVARIGQKVVSLLAGQPGSLLTVIWSDEDEDLEAVCNRAVDADIPVRDMTQAMEEVEFQDEDGEAVSEGEDEDEGDEAGATGEVIDAESEEGEFEPYTEEELNKADIEDLKQIAADFKIDVKPRSRKPTYVALILEAQEAALGESGTKDSGEDKESKTSGAEDGGSVDLDALAEQIVEALNLDSLIEAVNGQAEKITQRLDSVEEWMADIANRIDALGPKASPKASEGEEPKAGKSIRRRRL